MKRRQFFKLLGLGTVAGAIGLSGSSQPELPVGKIGRMKGVMMLKEGRYIPQGYSGMNPIITSIDLESEFANIQSVNIANREQDRLDFFLGGKS